MKFIGGLFCTSPARNIPVKALNLTALQADKTTIAKAKI